MTTRILTGDCRAVLPTLADQMQRDAILIDLDERNEPMARGRIEGDSSLFAEVA